jgi:hypothetical protein
MLFSLRPALALAAAALLLLLLLSSPRPAEGWEQKSFAITFLEYEHGPPARLPRYYEAIASLNFTVAEGWGEGRPAAETEQNLQAASNAGLDSIASGYPPYGSQPDGVPPSNSSSPHLLGYLVKDEPKVSDFADLARWTNTLAITRPGKLRLINLLPNCSAMGTAKMSNASYTEYVTRFVEQVRPDVLAFDDYPPFSDAGALHTAEDQYRTTLALFRKLALQHRIPLWNYFRSTAFQTGSGPFSTAATEAEMRWQTLTSLAYGATGLMYFNYPPGAIVSINGTFGPLAPMAKRINSVLLAYAPLLLHATSTDVWLAAPGGGQRPAAALPPANKSIVIGVAGGGKGGVLVGSFVLADGRQAALVQNQNWTAVCNVTVSFAGGLAAARLVDKVTGAEAPVASGLVALEAGDAELFVAAAAAAPEAGREPSSIGGGGVSGRGGGGSGGGGAGGGDKAQADVAKGGAACQTDLDCSLAGTCSASSGTCACDAAWTGPACERLHLLPAHRSALYPAGGHPTALPSDRPFPWGGSIMKGVSSKALSYCCASTASLSKILWCIPVRFRCHRTTGFIICSWWSTCTTAR